MLQWELVNGFEKFGATPQASPSETFSEDEQILLTEEHQEVPIPQESSTENPPNKIPTTHPLQTVGAAALAGAIGLATKGPLGAAEAAAHSVERSVQQEATEQHEGYAEKLQAWANFKEIITHPEVVADLDFLRQTFKNTFTGISFKADWDKHTADELLRIEAEQTAAGKTLTDSELGRQLLEEVATSYQEFWDKDGLASRVDSEVAREGLQANFTDFDSLTLPDGTKLTGEQAQQLIEEHIPNKRWLYENIGTYRFEPSERHEHVFQVWGTAERRSIENVLSAGREQEVVIYDVPTGIGKEALKRLVSHEVAHHHDWVGSLRLPMHERLDLLRGVTERYMDPEHLKSNYVDTLTPTNIVIEQTKDGGEIDQEQVLYHQVAEYWATINEQYDMKPEWLQQHYPKDHALVEHWRARLIQEPATQDQPSPEQHTPITSPEQSDKNI